MYVCFAKSHVSKLGLALIPRDPGVIVSCRCGRKIETMKSLSDVENAVQQVDDRPLRETFYVGGREVQQGRSIHLTFLIISQPGLM